MAGTLEQTRKLLGAVAATTCCIAVGAVVGVVPRVGGDAKVSIAAVAPEQAAMDRAAQLGGAPSEAPPTPVETAAQPAPSATTVAAPSTTAPDRAPAARPAPAPPTTERAVAEAPPAPPAVAVGAATPARRVPSPAEVQAAIRGMAPYVTFKSGLLGLVAKAPTPTAAQVNELGDLVCTALDEGQTVEQAKVTGLQMAADNPWVTISSAGADYVIRTAITLYCPGHADKLA